MTGGWLWQQFGFCRLPLRSHFFSARIQEYFNRKSVTANVALEKGVQECIETLQDLKANNAEKRYLKGLYKKIDDVEKRHIITELGTALFVFQPH